MGRFQTLMLPAEVTAVAPDGSDVRVLLQLGGGGFAHFELGPRSTSLTVQHRTVEEIWQILTGRGQMWRCDPDGAMEIVDLVPGVCLTIPVGTKFQFRSLGFEPLSAVAVTMPPWPGDDEAIVSTEGPWPASG